jgi:2-isopropylmalate synthase
VGDDDKNDDVEKSVGVPFSVGYKTGSVAVNQAVVKVELLTYDDAIAMDDAAYGAPVGRKTELCVSEGNGPVNALANALRLALVDAYPQLERIHLRDYKVDLLSTEGTSAATTRVTMDFADKDSDAVWRTVGAHASIIEASFRALVDGMEFGIAQCGPDGCDVAARYDQEKREAPAAR